MTLLVKNKEVVVPGQVLARGMDFLPSHGTYRRGEEIIADQVGLLTIDGKVLKSIPLAGKYLPRKGDTVIGCVIDILMSGWRLDLNGPYSAVLNMKDTKDFIPLGADLTKYFDLGDYLVCKITQVTSQNLIDVTARGPGLHKLQGGRIVRVNPQKVPRIIGKQGSMISLIKDKTKCRIIVGQNGLVWLEGDPKNELVAVKTFRLIEERSHLRGLTDTVKEFLDQQVKENGL
ncbi:RNA-binding protein [Candidatus Woesearchaeota archaeon]|nr:MAG: RNA-binding protein [Candidatus Woesearchaeota archaeon]